MKLSFTKKFVRHAVEVKLSFPYDTFGIEKMIENKMVHSGFLGYSIDIDLSFRTQIFNI
jgi:hypothetical protein